MIRVAVGLHNANANARAVVLLYTAKPSPSPSPSVSSISAADHYCSAVSFRERTEIASLTTGHRNFVYTSPAGNPTLLDVSAGGGPRPKKPRVWKTKIRRGSVAKSDKLIDLVNKLSNSKEEVYGALDAWIAWDLEFPLIAVKKALKTLKDQEDWRRIIQISKWMLDKGLGKTLGTYELLLQALDHEGRIEEARDLWEKLLKEHGECLPRIIFAQMIAMYDRYDKKKEILKVWVDMDELQINPDPATVQRVARAYSHFGYDEVGQALLERKTAITDIRYVKGQRVEFPIQPYRDTVSKLEVK